MRLSLLGGETKSLVEAGGKTVVITGFLIATDGTNAGTLQIDDKDGTVFPGPGFKVTGADEHGGAIDFNEDVSPTPTAPVRVSLVGTNSSAKVYYKPVA